jgi:hypothetical protein
MRLPDSEEKRGLLVVAIGVAALVAIHFWWVKTYRDGFPFSVDEAGYTAIGLSDWIGLRSTGVQGWWEAVQNQVPNAPLIPAMTSLLVLLKPSVLQGFVVLIGFFALLCFATYGIGERLAGPQLGALAALAVGTSAGAFTFTREYIFALPTAALLSCAVYALLRSDALRHRRWAVACGAALGLMLLARTMAVAFIPGVLAAAALMVVARWSAGRVSLRERLVNFALLVAAGAAVAATWYAKNMDAVVDYLTDFGYGSQSQYFGEEHSWLSWTRWTEEAERMTAFDLYVPLALLVLAGLVALGVLAVRKVLGAEDRRAVLIRLAGSDTLAVAIVVAAGYLALTTSQNAGNGFTLPISMLLPPLAVVALRHFRAALLPALAAVAAIAALNLIATSTITDDLSRPRHVDLPLVGSLPWTNGVPHAVEGIRVQVPGPESRFDDRDRGWIEADQALAELLLRVNGPVGTPPVTAFASRNRAISTNTVTTASLMKYQRFVPLTQLNAEPTDSVATYVRQLTDPQFNLPTALVTMSTNAGDFDPKVTQKYAEIAARRVGFRQVTTMTLPDGRRLRVWVKRPQSTAQRPTAFRDRSAGSRNR